MKSRNSFVSNSSSSSFVIRDWNKVPEKKRDMVLSYQKRVVEFWKNLGLPIVEECGCVHLDEKSIPVERRAELLGKYDFGWVDDGWVTKEFADHHLELVTVVDNFDMGKWLSYLGIDHDDTGESLGFFSDEEPVLRIDEICANGAPENFRHLIGDIERIRKTESLRDSFGGIEDFDGKLDVIEKCFGMLLERGLLPDCGFCVCPCADGISVETSIGDWRISIDFDFRKSVLLNNEYAPCRFFATFLDGKMEVSKNLNASDDGGGLAWISGFIRAINAVESHVEDGKTGKDDGK